MISTSIVSGEHCHQGNMLSKIGMSRKGRKLCPVESSGSCDIETRLSLHVYLIHFYLVYMVTCFLFWMQVWQESQEKSWRLWKSQVNKREHISNLLANSWSLGNLKSRVPLGNSSLNLHQTKPVSYTEIHEKLFFFL